MVFNPMKKKPMMDNPADEMTKGPHAEPDEDETYLDDAMMGGGAGEDNIFANEDPLESMLLDMGYKITPDQLNQIKAILQKPAAKPEAAKPATPGGAVPAEMTAEDLLK